MIDINTITTSEFKALFNRDFPYLPFFITGRVYFQDDIVYFNGNFYKSLTDNNTKKPTSEEYWQVYKDSEENYITDNDISRAFVEAQSNFNPKLFSCCEQVRMAFLYLAAHYLVIDLNNAQNPFAFGAMGIRTSRSVGSVSEGYTIPQWILNNKTLGLYAQTGYGLKYLTLIMPRLVGNLIFTKGYISFV